mgnify:CR=1 FL=1
MCEAPGKPRTSPTVARTADAAPACTTIAWHLTATRTLSPASRRTLARFTHVVSSSYSGSEVVEEALEAEGIKDPNVWEGPAMVPDVRSRKLLGRDCNEKCWRGVKRRMRVQRQLFPPKLVQDASGKAVGWDGDENFVVLLLLGRHEGTEDIARKGLENALLAFRKLRDVRENAFLFVHAPAAQFKWAREHASDGSGETYLRKAVDDSLIKQFTELVEYVGLRNGSYRFDFTNMAESHQGEILAASDVLLHPMLADGWALPIIEAQLVGTPVVSTTFMAMDMCLWSSRITMPPATTISSSESMICTPSPNGGWTPSTSPRDRSTVLMTIQIRSTPSASEASVPPRSWKALPHGSLVRLVTGREC